MSFEEFLKGFVLFRRTFPMLNIPDDTLEMWHSLLADLSFDLYVPALKHMLQNNPDWYPSSNFAGKILQSVKAIKAADSYNQPLTPPANIEEWKARQYNLILPYAIANYENKNFVKELKPIWERNNFHELHEFFEAWKNGEPRKELAEGKSIEAEVKQLTKRVGIAKCK